MPRCRASFLDEAWSFWFNHAPDFLASPAATTTIGAWVTSEVGRRRRPAASNPQARAAPIQSGQGANLPGLAG